MTRTCIRCSEVLLYRNRWETNWWTLELSCIRSTAREYYYYNSELRNDANLSTEIGGTSKFIPSVCFPLNQPACSNYTHIRSSSERRVGVLWGALGFMPHSPPFPEPYQWPLDIRPLWLLSRWASRGGEPFPAGFLGVCVSAYADTVSHPYEGMSYSFTCCLQYHHWYWKGIRLKWSSYSSPVQSKVSEDIWQGRRSNYAFHRGKGKMSEDRDASVLITRRGQTNPAPIGWSYEHSNIC